MKVLIELNPVEAKAAISSGMLLALVEVVHGAEQEIKTANTPVAIPQQIQYSSQTPTVQQPQTQQPVQQQIIQQVPTAVQTYTMEQLAVAATQIVDTGRRQELVNLLNSFGVQALTALPKEQYGAFATSLRQMGAKI